MRKTIRPLKSILDSPHFIVYTVITTENKTIESEGFPMYTSIDFIELERMDNEDLEETVEQAKEFMNKVQDEYMKLEMEMQSECAFLVPDVNILVSKLRNIEAYIRKAENMMREWDTERYVERARARRFKHTGLLPKPFVRINL